MGPPSRKTRDRHSSRAMESMATEDDNSGGELSDQPMSDNSDSSLNMPKKKQAKRSNNRKSSKAAATKDKGTASKVTSPAKTGKGSSDTAAPATLANSSAVQDVEMEDKDNEDEEGGIRIGDIYLPPPAPPACTFESNGPRLVITQIENDFFKSYAGRQVLGPFHKSFSSVVGPNGSGKSNVIDGMLFVFGYRAQKTRSKKICNLIHNSEAHPNVQSCSVAVHFEKIIDISDDEFEVVPNTKFVVSRTVFKDNSSFYQLNGKRCPFKVVAKVLRTEGIDLDHNRFLILQGEVEQIAMMKPKAVTEHDTGMLEYLEDIVGSTRFKEPIELLSKRVEELNEQREEKLNRVKLVEKEKDELEGPKDIAVTHIKQENEITRKKNVLFQGFIHNSSKAMNGAQEKKKKIDDGLSDVKKELAELSEAKKEKESGMKSLGKDLERVVKTKEDSNEKFKGLESEDNKLQEDLKHKNQKRKKIIAQLKTDDENLEELITVPEKNEANIEECKGLKKNFEGNRAKEEEAYGKAMESLNSETQQLQDEKAELETKLIDLRKAVDETKSVVDIAQSELDIYLSTERNEQKKYDQITSSLEKAREMVTKRKEEVDKLAVAVPEYEGNQKTAKKELQQIVAELSQVEGQLGKERVKLEESRSAMQSSRSRGRVQDALLEQKMNGNIPGIFGRLGDLGGIDATYDVAISTACGALDNLVVDTVETGQACIRFLKETNSGTATFIALDKMEKWRRQTTQKIQTPENVPRLFDLIRVNDERVKTAFYFAIRDTIVANDLDQASRIAYGRVRHRVVTLRGELIEPSGTMSGGGRSVLKGRMGKDAQAVVDVDPRELARTESAVEELTQKSSQLRRQRAETENTLQRTTKDLSTMKMNLQKYKMDIEASSQQLGSLEKQLKEQEAKLKQIKSDPEKIKKMEAEISKKVDVYSKAAKNAEGVEGEVAAIHKQILSITGGKMKTMKKSLDDINKKLEKVNAEITRLTVAIKTAKRNTSKTQDKISGQKTEKEEVEKDMLAMAAKRKEIEKDAAEVLEKLQASTQEEDEVKEKIGELKAEHDKIMKHENKIKASKIEIDQEIEKFDGIIKENKSKIGHWKKKLSKLELQEVPLTKEGEDNSTTLDELSEEALQDLDVKKLEYELEMKEDQLAQCRPNLAVIQEYRKKEEIYLQRVSELDDITSSRDDQRKHHDNLRKQRLNEFMAGFSIISNKLKEMYQMITLGGDAELELVDSLDPFSEGIVFSVRPPKKSWKNITNLSGGEKTLSSLALVFALHYYKPTPLYVMDEIDAALDFKNVSIVANYIKERTKNAQFIIISLRSQMFELADRLIGIYKTYNCTKTVTINPGLYDNIAPTAPTQQQPPLGSSQQPPPARPMITGGNAVSNPLAETQIMREPPVITSQAK
uniref:Structural maintenance of chromosomes protein n=1 Tax=Hirondellea gigas TaxID=1518452 RepID=A0A2P2HWI0_9CRUS